MQQIRTNAVAAAICIAGALPVAAHAQSCRANSNALGTSRILVVAPTDYMRLGTMQYPETLPLAVPFTMADATTLTERVMSARTSRTSFSNCAIR
jgi:hypothetical protein